MTRSAATGLKNVAAVLLAAGGSRRLGFPKQFVRYRARPLLSHALGALRYALPDGPFVVVVGAHALRLRSLVRRELPTAKVVMNARWADGLTMSLQAGIAAVPRNKQAILVTLVDQPHVDGRALRRVLSAWRKRPGLPAAASYDGRTGVPAVLPRRYWREIRNLRGDEGARALVRGNTNLTRVDLPEAAVDVDTPADVAKLRAQARPRAAT